MNKWTKEPWRVAGHNAAIVVCYPEGREPKSGAAPYASLGGALRDEREANARRICAAVNACAGIPNEVLECDTPTFIAMLQERHSLRKQRDELLAALQRYVEHFGDPLQCANAAIAKAEAQS